MYSMSFADTPQAWKRSRQVRTTAMILSISPLAASVVRPESLALGKQVVDARRAAVGADRHGEVATLKADYRRGHQVVRRRQAPTAAGAAHRVVAGMVVVV